MNIFLGEDLNIIKVSRLHMGMYLCTATSSYYQAPTYQPVTRSVMLHVLCEYSKISHSL